MVLKWLAGIFVLALFALALWGSDRITYQGERTVFTVDCRDGAWDGLRCTGRLVAGDRHRFRASTNRQEVLYWVVGSTSPSGRFTDCRVKSRGNWSCNVTAGQPPTVAHEMTDDRPSNHVAGLDQPYRAVAKWKWALLNAGVHVFGTADY
jgi:hypothetical protein